MATFTYEKYASALKTATLSGTTTFSGAVNFGEDDTGYDITMYGDTASRYWMWDTSADGVVQRGTLTVGVDDTGHDVKLFGATSGRYWLWDESADGVVQIGTLTIGADDAGHDVIFYGDTTNRKLTWDTSADSLLLTDSTPLKIGTSQDMTLYHDGTNSYITNSTGDLIVDAEADIQLDANGGDVILKDAGTQFGGLANTSSDFVVSSSIQDKDLIFKGNDGGSQITALTLDMSAAGAATFNNDITAFSDERLKSDIRTIDNALNLVGDMRGVYFNRDGVAGTGVIAQEIQNILPEVVHDKQEYLSVAYGNMVGVLIEAIKELKKEVETLKEAK